MNLLRARLTPLARWCPPIARALLVAPLAAMLLAGASAACRDRGKATLSHLRGVEELKARFNRDAGTPRIVLLLSPT